MGKLRDIIISRIRADGPISVAEYMNLCLSHPEHGYYTTRDPFGADGDFTTSPEITQMFGEMIGLWLVQSWIDAGSPNKFRLVEFGPGRGTLMADILRATRAGPGFNECADVWLVETSPRLRALQAERVPKAHWAVSFDEVPDGPLFVVANEFFDALPIRQFIASPDGWREKMVGLEGDDLSWGLSPPLPSRYDTLAAPWREVSPMAERLAVAIARRIDEHGGAALIIDYGHDADSRPPGFTLQAMRHHEPADPLHAPGRADLTWLPDLDLLAQTLRPLAVDRTTQGAFLTRMGIGQRAKQLAKASPRHSEAIAHALERLTSEAQMGGHFKVIAARPKRVRRPVGFAEDKA